jgi:ribonucleotide reductase beta subunit family protein with ferritin-like domain
VDQLTEWLKDFIASINMKVMLGPYVAYCNNEGNRGITGVAVIDSTKQMMFFGPDLAVQRYDDMKYPIFDKLNQQQLGYFWRPEEISLQKDRNDYQNLTEQQKFIFTSNLKYQTMLDSVQGRGPCLAFLPFCSLPELEGCIVTWDFIETIHSRSYTYIIKNLYSNPGEIFDTIIQDEKIERRALM